MDEELEKNWNEILLELEPMFGADLDLQAVLFIVGMQELGKGYITLGKDEKLNIMHVAICTLLTPYGFYEYEGLDADGWPHWKATEKLPALKPAQQNQLMKQALINYFSARDKDEEE